MSRCKDCPKAVKAACKYTFGKFYAEKSSGGTGCGFPPFGEREATRLKSAIGFDDDGHVPGPDEF